MANDEEYSAALAEAKAKQKAAGEEPERDDSPPMVTYTAEVEGIHMLVNEMRILRSLFIQSKSEKGAPQVKPDLLSGPKTAMQRALQRAEYLRKKAKHEALVARVLPHRRRQDRGEEPPVG